MKLDMKSKKNKANSHRGRGKEIAYPDTSDGQKGTLLSMNVSDISNALKAGGIGKRSTAPENPADWTMRANLIPRSIVGLNRDRAIKYHFPAKGESAVQGCRRHVEFAGRCAEGEDCHAV